MAQKEVSLVCVLAWFGWGLAIVSAGFSLATPDLHLASLVVLFAAAGATLHVRGMIDGLCERELNAYNLGRDHERGVRSVR